MNKIAKTVKKVTIQFAVLLSAGISLSVTLTPVAKADNNNKIAQAAERVVGDINRGDADQHCKYWYKGQNAYVKSFDTDTAVAICSKNGQNSFGGTLGGTLGTGGLDGTINGTYNNYEGAIDINVSFDELCVGKYEQNPYSRVQGVSNVRYDYWQGHCVGTFDQGNDDNGGFPGNDGFPGLIFFPLF
jgi:hypothetical protein